MQSTTQAVAVKLTPTHRMGLATSTFFILLRCGIRLWTYILGSIIPITGYRTLYVILGALVILTIIPYFFLYGRKEKAILLAE